MGFTEVTDKEQLLGLAERIKQDFPQSCLMYNNLLLHARGFCSTGSFYIIEDSPDSYVILQQSNDEPSYFTPYCREYEVDQLMKALEETSLVNWRGDLFGSIQTFLVNPIHALAQKMGLSLTEEKYYRFTYHLHLDTDTLRCPSRLRLCKLGKAGVRRLLEASKYHKNFPLEPMLRFNQNVPSVGVFLDNTTKEDTLVALENILPAGDEDIPISWIASAKYGALGMLRTEESYKKQGLGTLVTRAAARLQANLGYLPLAFVELDNKPSQAMFTKMPEFIRTHTISWMFSDTAENC